MRTPLVINCAIPRPAIIKISVATIGWIFMYATRKPFHSPNSVATSSVTTITSHSGE